MHARKVVYSLITFHLLHKGWLDGPILEPNVPVIVFWIGNPHRALFGHIVDHLVLAVLCLDHQFFVVVDFFAALLLSGLVRQLRVGVQKADQFRLLLLYLDFGGPVLHEGLLEVGHATPGVSHWRSHQIGTCLCLRFRHH